MQFLGALRRAIHHAGMPVVGFVPHEVPVMTDRRLLRRYLSLVRHADELFDECCRPAAEAAPVPAEAAALLDDLAASLGPILQSMPEATPDPEDMRRQLAGWVH